MKAEVSAYWRYVRGMKYVGVEADYMDVMAANDSTPPAVIETEVKVTLADLRADGSKEKHQHIELELRGELYRWRPDSTPHRMWTPTRFMFAVPHYLHERALPVVQDLYPYAGLLVVNPSWSELKGHSVWVALRGKVIRKDQTFARVKWAMREQGSALVRELGRGVAMRAMLETQRLGMVAANEALKRKIHE